MWDDIFLGFESLYSKTIYNSMITKITILGRPISKKNNRRNFFHTSLPSKAYERFKEDALWQLKKTHHVFYQDYYKINYKFFMKGKLNTDFDNMIGGINDILQDAGIIVNDGLVEKGSYEKIRGCIGWWTELEIEGY